MNAAAPLAFAGETEAQQLDALVAQLVQIATNAPTHRLMLIALMSTFKTVAIVHPCCAQEAAASALQVGGDLLVRSLDTRHTGPIH